MCSISIGGGSAINGSDTLLLTLSLSATRKHLYITQTATISTLHETMADSQTYLLLLLLLLLLQPQPLIILCHVNFN